MAAKVNLPVQGVIENMSWFTGDDGKRYEIFGAGGGQELADELGVPLLGKLPLVPALREGGDDGRPITAVDPDSEAARRSTRWPGASPSSCKSEEGLQRRPQDRLSFAAVKGDEITSDDSIGTPERLSFMQRQALKGLMKQARKNPDEPFDSR